MGGASRAAPSEPRAVGDAHVRHRLRGDVNSRPPAGAVAAADFLPVDAERGGDGQSSGLGSATDVQNGADAQSGANGGGAPAGTQCELHGTWPSAHGALARFEAPVAPLEHGSILSSATVVQNGADAQSGAARTAVDVEFDALVAGSDDSVSDTTDDEFEALVGSLCAPHVSPARSSKAGEGGGSAAGMRYWLVVEAGVREAFVGRALEALEQHEVVTVDDLAQLEQTPAFDACLSALTGRKVREGLLRRAAAAVAPAAIALTPATPAGGGAHTGRAEPSSPCQPRVLFADEPAASPAPNPPQQAGGDGARAELREARLAAEAAARREVRAERATAAARVQAGVRGWLTRLARARAQEEWERELAAERAAEAMFDVSVPFDAEAFVRTDEEGMAAAAARVAAAAAREEVVVEVREVAVQLAAAKDGRKQRRRAKRRAAMAAVAAGDDAASAEVPPPGGAARAAQPSEGGGAVLTKSQRRRQQRQQNRARAAVTATTTESARVAEAVVAEAAVEVEVERVWEEEATAATAALLAATATATAAEGTMAEAEAAAAATAAAATVAATAGGARLETVATPGSSTSAGDGRRGKLSTPPPSQTLPPEHTSGAGFWEAYCLGKSTLGCCMRLPDSALVDVCEVCIDMGVEPSGPPEWEFVLYAVENWEYFVGRALGPRGKRMRMLKVVEAREAEKARAFENWAGLVRRAMVPGVDAGLRAERAAAEARAARAAAEKARRAAAGARCALEAGEDEYNSDDMDDGEAALEAKYERDAFLHFMEYARVFGGGDSDDEAGDGAVGAANTAGGLSEGLAMVWGCD